MSSDPTTTPVAPDVERKVDDADTTLQNPRTAVVALGSNLGNRLDMLQGAIDSLGDTPGMRVKKVSGVYETEPVGGPADQPTYFNAVVLVRTTLPPSSLLERANAIEEAYERVREERWGPRTLDVDILAYEDVITSDDQLTLPHPRAHERGFVLAPWNEIDPDAVVPGHGPVADLLAEVGIEGVTRRDDLSLHLPE
ncbi:2-amino-4-hydroxy-6-hydroxymethyldihydropteridine diphosphokinase [Allostreptomyces psammosilenae]|uniref:2-amino-4-hydroxy-6-hydroxymethyldihydropteridine diphosphokinase n=1 Tax=Allostreptomyces psammosilenae TaxID=1892865 RepID=A0A853A5B2_9ACTN|nr:2-amino-4-hydroxy-6-hydroxymethyldihydropteridine diphosphokinase [Allostreptomyces psammosilenae]NYI05682.1 2-amino-4-hydroxy-6-hydroxymethyldihydropteridine diphosphokinase [Allostreptomyces psammosilenae]